MAALAIEYPRSQETSQEPVRPILLVSPIESDHSSLQRIFQHANWALHEAQSLEEARTALLRHNVGIVISERDLSGHTWKDVLRTVDQLATPPSLIVCARLADEYLWAEVLNLGGYDVLATPFEASEVVRVVDSAWRHWQRRNSSIRRVELPALQAAG